MTHDLHDTLDAIRPDATALDEQWSRTTLDSILATPVAATTRPTPLVPRARRVRAVVAGTVGIGLLGAGAAAAATGLVPHDFGDTFSSWGTISAESEPGRQAVDPATARRVATAQGPGETVFSVVAAPGRDGYSCVAVLFETPASIAAPVPSDFVDADGSQCAAAPASGTPFGAMAASDVQRLPDALGEPDVRVVSLSAGPADRAVIRTGDGDEYPVLRFDGRFYGWFAGYDGDASDAVVVGYAADGTEVGRARF